MKLMIFFDELLNLVFYLQSNSDDFFVLMIFCEKNGGCHSHVGVNHVAQCQFRRPVDEEVRCRLQKLKTF